MHKNGVDKRKKTKKIISIFAISMFLLVGCKSDAAYKEAMELGNEALKNGKYEVALTEFEKALEEKKDDEIASSLYNQIEKYIKALEYDEKNKFDESLELLEEVINYENGSEVLVNEAKNLKIQVQKAKELDEKVNKLTKSSQEYFSNKKYSKAIEDIEKALELIKDNEFYDSQRESLTDLKSNCEEAIEKIAKEQKQREEEKVKEAKKQQTSSNKSGISQEKAVEILSNYFKKEIGYAPNTIEVYEVIGNRYHMTADNYDENDMRESFGWWYVDKSTGEVSR